MTMIMVTAWDIYWLWGRASASPTYNFLRAYFITAPLSFFVSCRTLQFYPAAHRYLTKISDFISLLFRFCSRSSHEVACQGHIGLALLLLLLFYLTSYLGSIQETMGAGQTPEQQTSDSTGWLSKRGERRAERRWCPSRSRHPHHPSKDNKGSL